jgi:hypothetical protein
MCVVASFGTIQVARLARKLPQGDLAVQALQLSGSSSAAAAAAGAAEEEEDLT